MMKWIFLGLGLLWTGIAIKDYFAHAGEDVWRVALQGLMLGAINFAVAFYLNWRQQSSARGR